MDVIASMHAWDAVTCRCGGVSVSGPPRRPRVDWWAGPPAGWSFVEASGALTPVPYAGPGMGEGNTRDAGRCATCGFNAREWRARDAATVFAALGYWWAQATAGVEAGTLRLRPGAVTCSVLERARLVLESCEGALGAARPREGARVGDGKSMHAALEDVGSQLGAVVGADGDAAPWATVHEVTHGFMDIAVILARAHAATPHARGTVVQVNVSAGGVPKRPVGAAAVSWDGLEGDRQADRKHHGRPFQAVCLWSAEVISELAGAGHPIAAGCAGENVTLTGLTWSSLRPGTRLLAGSALFELSYPATPCKKQARWFADGDFERISDERHPEWTRWYAWVRSPGAVACGDVVVVQPAGADLPDGRPTGHGSSPTRLGFGARD